MPVIDLDCPRCNGTGWIVTESGTDSVPCNCQALRRRNRRFEAAGIPERYAHCTIEEFSDRSNGSLLQAKRRAKEFVEGWPLGKEGLLLMGGCGTGKTHLAVAVLRSIIDLEKPGKLVFSNFQDLIQEIQASFDSSEVPRKSEILKPILEADLLVLDELGSQKPTSFVHDTLYYIINSRYNDELSTIFTTNYVDEPSAKEESLTDRIGERLRSRLYEMTERVLFESADYRVDRNRGTLPPGRRI